MKAKAFPFLDRKLIQVLLVYYSVAYIIDFSGSALIYSQNESSSIVLSQLAIQYLIFFVAKLSYILIALWLTRNFFKRSILNIWIIGIHLSLAALLSFYTAVVGLILDIELFSNPITVTFESIYIRGLGGLSFNFFMYFSIIAIVYAYNYFQRKKADDLKTSILKAELLDSKIRALQAQLNPHFLFNSLNDISSLIDENKVNAQNAIADLSVLLRKTLNLQNSKLILLEDELELLETYVKMEKLRYDDKWEFVKSIPENLEQFMIPPLLFQPLIENSIKHGFSENHQKIKTLLHVKRNTDYLEINIINNGRPLKSDSPIIGNGIGNVLERLSTLFPENFEFHISNYPDYEDFFDEAVVSVGIKLPALTEYHG